LHGIVFWEPVKSTVLYCAGLFATKFVYQV
jgi:hypothetical protein